MVSIVSISEKLYIGIADDKGFDTVSNPKAFITPFEKDDKAFQKRKETVDNWSSYCDYETGTRIEHKGFLTYIDNIAQTGFSIKSYVSRYSTSNKFVEVTDPRGFTLEISIENLVDLMQICTIKNGVILESCVWGRANNSCYLVPVTSETYRLSKSEKVTLSDLKVGDRIICAKSGSLGFVYLGKKYVTVINRTDTLVNGKLPGANRHVEYTYDAVPVTPKAIHCFYGGKKSNRYGAYWVDKLYPEKTVTVQALMERNVDVSDLLADGKMFDLSYDYPTAKYASYAVISDDLYAAEAVDTDAIIKTLPKDNLK